MDEPTFAATLTREADYAFSVTFDGQQPGTLLMDEPAPLGTGRGPNATRLLAAAIGHCLSASLLFCLTKSRVAAAGLRTTVEGHLTRNAAGRLQIGEVRVTLHADTDPAAEARLRRCVELFEDFCIVTESVRHGIAVDVRVAHADGGPVPPGARAGAGGPEPPATL